MTSLRARLVTSIAFLGIFFVIINQVQAKKQDQLSNDKGNKKDENDSNKQLFCAVMNPNTGSYIDLSHLSSTPNEESENNHKSKKDKKRLKDSTNSGWLVKGYGEDKGTNFTIGICSSPAISEDALKQINNQTGAFYKENGNNYVSIGDFSSKPNLFGSNNRKITLRYENGTICPNGVDRKATILNFVCDRETTSKAVINYIGNLHDCSYFFEVRSIYACPASYKTNEINVLGIFFGIFAVFLLVEVGRRWLTNKLSMRSNHGIDNGYDNLTNNLDAELEPRWEFFEDESVLVRLLRNVVRTSKSISSKLFNVLTREQTINRRSSNGHGTIRLSYSNGSQPSFVRDMEAQNEIIDNLDINSDSIN